MLPKPDTCKGCPLYERPHGKIMGFSVPSGTGLNGVMIVAEALGEAEEKEGMGLVGKSGYALFQQLKRVDIERDDFTIFNTIACRPADNKLVKMSYEHEAIRHCAPNLDNAIAAARVVAKSQGKTFVIVTLGATAFKRVLDLDYKKNADLLKKHNYGYPFWSDSYGAWVFNVPHPAFLLRGNTHLWPVVQFVFARALEVAKDGLRLDEPDYLLDPTPSNFDEWIKGFERSLAADSDNPLSYDIETPYKKETKDEEELGKEEDADHTILRCSFAYVDKAGTTHTTSVKWSAEYMAGIERLFYVANYVLGWNSDKYDQPRVVRHVPIRGIGLDGMVAWHILNTSLPKALGFVTPFYWQKTLAWKHLADTEPAFYNAKDADAALRNFIGIKRDLIANGLWHVYERHWIELSKALKFMSGVGVKRDDEMRSAAEAQMSTMLDGIELRMEEAVPADARELKIYKKTPKVIEVGMHEISKDYPAAYCALCGIAKAAMRTKFHLKCGGKNLIECMEAQTVWAKPLPFKVSKKRMSSYQHSLRHQAIIDRKEKKVTFDADALTLLMRKYPNDKLYPLILDHRKVQKLLSTYVGVTEYIEVDVQDDYILKPGEQWILN